MFKKLKYLIPVVLFAGFFGFLAFGQTMAGSGGTIYENRSCYPRPGTTGTECVIENPQGLCTEKSVCA